MAQKLIRGLHTHENQFYAVSTGLLEGVPW